MQSKRIHDALLEWYACEGRDLPWRRTRDPYAILVSEMMLQQTQVDRVVPKYEAWLREFPDWRRLAAASRADVLRLWSGLGYNSRAVRLHLLARVLTDSGGALPEVEQELVKLPGIGPYTAGALLVFAWNRPGACVDTNIERIMRRLHYTIEERPSLKELKQRFLDSFPGRARDWGNALMDLGSRICTASRPACEECPVRRYCSTRGEHPAEGAIRKGRQQTPFKESNRWWRGRIVKALTEKQWNRDALRAHLGAGERSFEKALDGLKAEGLVSGGHRLKLSDRT